MKNQIKKTFLTDDTWVCPAGVTQVVATIVRQLYPLSSFNVNNSLFIDSENNGIGMGANSTGELGDGTVTQRSGGAFSTVTGGYKFRQMMVNGGLSAGGDILTWGGGANGFQGDNTITNRSSPASVYQVSAQKWRLAGGSCAGISVLGDAYTWGDNSNGSLGNNTSVANTSTPVLVVGGYKWKSLSGSYGSGYNGLTFTNDAYGWGNGNLIGANNTTSTSSPVAVAGGYKWKQLGRCCGVIANGDGYCWGGGNSGESGSNTTQSVYSSPVLVVGGYKWKQIIRGSGSQTYGITVNDDLYAWGYNFYGALGDGTKTNRSSPVLVLGGYKWAAVANGQDFAIGMTTTGELMAWGVNSNFGQVGNAAGYSSPVQVLNTKQWRAQTSEIGTRLLMDVVPGTSYTVKILQKFITMNNVVIGDGTGDTSLVLEYLA